MQKRLPIRAKRDEQQYGEPAMKHCEDLPKDGT